MNAEEQFYLEQLKLMQRVRDALLGLGEFGTDRSSQDLLFFNTEMMLTCELEFEDILPGRNRENTDVTSRCSTSVGSYIAIANFGQQSTNEDFEKFSRGVFQAAVCAREGAAVENKLREIRRTLGMEN